MSEGTAVATSTNKINPASFIDEHGMTKFAIGQVILVLFCGMFEGFDFMLVSYTMPQISAEWGLNAVQTGSLASWAVVGCIVGGIAGGIISDKIGRKKTMIASVFLFSLLTIPVAFAPNYAAFAALRILAGLAIGSALPLKVSMAAENSTTKRRTLVTGIACGATPLGYIFASIVSIFVVPVWGWRPVFLFASAGLLLCVILVPFLKESPYWALKNGRAQETCDYLNKVRISAKSSEPEITVDMLDIPPKVAREKISYSVLFSSRKLAITTIGAALIYFCAMSTLYGINSWYPSLMLAQGYEIASAYGFSMAMNISGLLGNVVAGALLQVLGRRRGEIVGFAAAIICVLFMAFVGGGSMILMVTSAILVGFAINYLPPSVNGVTPELFPTNARGSGVSFVMSIGRVAGLLAPVVAGALLDFGIDYSGLITCFALPCVLGIILVLVFLRNDNMDKSLDEVS